MGEVLNIRDVNPTTKAKLAENAAAANMSLAAYVRLKLDEIAGTPKRPIGLLEKELGHIGDPIDGWGPMSDKELDQLESDGDARTA